MSVESEAVVCAELEWKVRASHGERPRYALESARVASGIEGGMRPHGRRDFPVSEGGDVLMAATKSKPRTKKASSPVKADEKDPLSWLYVNPEKSSNGVVFGVLRKTFRGRTNSAQEFGFRKCHLGSAFVNADRSVWAPNAEKVEVILPARADDTLSDPDVLLRQVDAFACPYEAGLLTYLTVPLSDVERLHVGWELARSFAVRLACERAVASIVILHSPGSIGSAFPLHAHLLVIPRSLNGLGLRHAPFDSELLRDDGQGILSDLWDTHCR